MQIKKIRKALGQDTEPAPQQAAEVRDAPSVGFVAPQIDRHILEKYKTLSDDIREKESLHVEENARQAYGQLQQLQSNRKSTFEMLGRYEGAEAEARRKLDELNQWYMAKLIPGKLGKEKRAKKKERREAAFNEASNNVKKQQEKLIQIDRELKQAQESWNQMNSVVENYQRSRKEKDALLESIFSRPEWMSDPHISHLRNTLNIMRSKSSELNQHRGTYSRGQEFLASARNKISRALQLLQRTRMMGMFQMGANLRSPGRRTPGNLMMSMADMMRVQQANDLVKSAANDYLSAKQILPALPFQNNSAVSSARAGVFASILAPGMGGNMVQQIMVRKSMQTVQEIQVGVNQCLDYCKRNIDAISMDINRAESEVAAKVAELQTYQRGQLESALRNLQ